MAVKFMLKSQVHVLLISRKPRFVLCLNVIKIIRKKSMQRKKTTNRNSRSIRVLLPRWAVVIVVECFFSGNGKVFLESQVIFQGGLPGRVPFPRGILRIISNFSKGLPGSFFRDHPGNGKVL